MDLNVARQYLVRLLNEGRSPHTETGWHRRVRIEDVLAFRESSVTKSGKHASTTSPA